MRLRTRNALAALPLALTLALTGCGSDDAGGGTVASAGGEKKGDSGSSPAKSMNPDEMGVKFAQCMRENGVDMEDPEPGKGSRLTLKKGAESEKALEACREYNPQENGSAKADPKAEENGRKFAQCMRENGLEEFPDPQPGQRGIRVDRKIGEDPDFAKAQKNCQGIFSGGPGGPGGGADQ
ncbi:hypothetical protein FHR32_003032 [Streptosporangium album]|uniref:Secreted protein n=1 Tax=Streptosporangium album TaxID=47479 RepID=A0A7W7W8V2_9ACTN|nr:hypothetical protein [Streptosporangium album]MBB4938727.1 hypothetical protein [Streptosporangium album]